MLYRDLKATLPPDEFLEARPDRKVKSDRWQRNGGRERTRKGSEIRRSGRGSMKESEGGQKWMEGWTVCVSDSSNETDRDKHVNKGRLAGNDGGGPGQCEREEMQGKSQQGFRTIDKEVKMERDRTERQREWKEMTRVIEGNLQEVEEVMMNLMLSRFTANGKICFKHATEVCSIQG